MSVLDRFPRPIEADQVARGERLMVEGDVQVRPAGSGAVRGVVFDDDAGRIDTELTYATGPVWGFVCECELSRSGSVCAHIVATALAAERQGLLPKEHLPERETRPRNRDRSGVWLSSTGQIRRAEEDEEPRPVIKHQPSLPSWKKLLARLKEDESQGNGAALIEAWPADRQILYIIDVPASLEEKTLVIRLACRDRRSSGEWSRPKTRGISFPDVSRLTDPQEQQLLAVLKGSSGRGETYQSYDPSYRVPEAMRRHLVSTMCRSGRALLRLDVTSDDLSQLEWDEGPAWEFWVECRREESTQQYVFNGMLRRGSERLSITRPVLALGGGLVFFQDRAAALDDGGAAKWISLLRLHRSMHVPFAQVSEMLGEMFAAAHLPRMDLPEELRVERVQVKPRPRLAIRAPGREEFRPDRLRAELSFDYGGMMVGPGDESHSMVYEPKRRQLIVRDLGAERAALVKLRRLGLRDAMEHSREAAELWFHQRHMARVVRVLVQDGWAVEADGQLYRRALGMALKVSSGVDWFELRGEIDFGGRTARLTDLLAAIRRGEGMVRLDDGTFGMVPEAWLKQYGLLAGMGTAEEDHLKLGRNQVGLLDALLASEPAVSCDEAFERTRRELNRFEGIGAQDAPEGFVGELRPYQREGLGWFAFLEHFGFGGCLADDMGLGKTVQVLALLEARRQLREELAGKGNGNGKRQGVGPSLVVVPKSLVFNWKQEASRFAPKLRLLEHTGIDRVRATEHLAEYDAVITTYGTLRRDAVFLKDVEFDYIVLDEAQAIKNPSSESAKAVRLVKGRQRLALSGTPVQNHLGDLWSLFDFLNPGMLGVASVFMGTAGILRNPDAETRGLLSRALRPFILRRTKEQVASDLPPKLEQTIYCELDNGQRQLYDELREGFRRSLLLAIDRDGLGKSKMQILEALLRLRQVALHPGLVDKSRLGESSAKLDMLLTRLDEIVQEGHKALVFSQFTSMLDIVRQRLDQEKVSYEYLDGQTRDREARVQRFQKDETCRLFLVSLKAGGLGLNLTAADYVFLLDPWWNPAVEQQAIDRAHRIGQNKHVYACRLIAKDTVEEKVLALQQSKRELAEAIITADNSLVRNLGREELELLLS